MIFDCTSKNLQKKHMKSTKERAEVLIELLNKKIVSSLASIQSLTQSYFNEFDEISKLSDVMPCQFKSENRKSIRPDASGRKVIDWGHFNTAGLPDFSTTNFTSSRETLAHHELTAEKELFSK